MLGIECSIIGSLQFLLMVAAAAIDGGVGKLSTSDPHIRLTGEVNPAGDSPDVGSVMDADFTPS